MGVTESVCGAKDSRVGVNDIVDGFVLMWLIVTMGLVAVVLGVHANEGIRLVVNASKVLAVEPAVLRLVKSI